MNLYIHCSTLPSHFFPAWDVRRSDQWLLIFTEYLFFFPRIGLKHATPNKAPAHIRPTLSCRLSEEPCSSFMLQHLEQATHVNLWKPSTKSMYFKIAQVKFSLFPPHSVIAMTTTSKYHSFIWTIMQCYDLTLLWGG